MTVKTRLIILFICAALFLAIAPIIVLYSTGYRIDFENRGVVATGGIYVRAMPLGADIAIDSKGNYRTGFFSGYVFVQNLLPKSYLVTIAKEGYHTYQKTLPVKGKEVTKLENVILFKEEIPFSLQLADTDMLSLAPNSTTLLAATSNGDSLEIWMHSTANGQTRRTALAVAQKGIPTVTWAENSQRALLGTSGGYFIIDLSQPVPTAEAAPYLTGAASITFNPQSPSELFFIRAKSLYSNTAAVPILRNVAAYKLQNGSILWLSSEGAFWRSGLDGKLIEAASQKPHAMKKNAAYALHAISSHVFLQQNDELFLFDADNKTFERFYSSAHSLFASPDGRTILYCNDRELLLSPVGESVREITLLNRFSGTVGQCGWINHEYVIFSLDGRAMISETDVRGNVNVIALPESIRIGDEAVAIENARLFFSRPEEKIILLAGGNVLISEGIIP